MLNPKTIGDRLNGLANIYGTREIGGSALITWLDSLEGEQERDVLSVLDAWPRYHERMPLPAQVIAECQRRRDESFQAAKADELSRKESMADFVNRSAGGDQARVAAVGRVLADYGTRRSLDPRPDTFWQAELVWKFAQGERLRRVQIEMLHSLFGDPIPQAVIDRECRRYQRVFGAPVLDYATALKEERARRSEPEAEFMNLLNDQEAADAPF